MSSKKSKLSIEIDRQIMLLAKKYSTRGEIVDQLLIQGFDISYDALSSRMRRLDVRCVPEPVKQVHPVERAAEKKQLGRERTENRQLVEELSTFREQNALREALASAALKPVKRRELGSNLREATAVALLSDCHVDEIVKIGDTPLRNEYNLTIAEASLGRFFSGVEWLIKFHRERDGLGFKIRDLVLWFGGDLGSGHIHDELKETTVMAPIATMLWIFPRLVAGVDQLLALNGLERLLLVCSYGNHGRDTLKPRRATGAHHSYEWGMYQHLAQHYAGNKRVDVLADPSGHQYVQVYDYTLHFHHGDEVAYGGGVGGITIPLNKAVAQWDRVRKSDYHHFGHFHQYIDTGNVLVNGSLIGYNAYAMSIKASPEPPQQAFYLLDSTRGKTCKSPIWVREQNKVLDSKVKRR